MSDAYGVEVPAALHDAIEAERDSLSKAESLLGCLAIAMESEFAATTGPYYPDVAEVARQLVRQSINALDSVMLQRLLARDAVKEPALVLLSSVQTPARIAAGIAVG